LTSFPERYGGLVEVDQGQHIDIYLTTLSPTIEAAFDRLAPAGDLTFLRTDRSLEALGALQQRVTASASTLRAQGVTMVEWWPSVQTGREMIGVVDLRSSDETLLAERFGSNDINSFNLSADQVLVLTSGRDYDEPPWKGGDYITDHVFGCTSGFGVKIDGQNRLLTAAHCFHTGEEIFNGRGDEGGSNDQIGTVAQRLTASGASDAEAIAANSADRVYLGPYRTTSVATIAGQVDNPVGATVYNDGAYSGLTGALTIVARDMCIQPGGFRRECGVVEAVGSIGEIANQDGDSGGPMPRAIDGKAYAAGLVSASTTADSISCVHNLPDQCYTNVFYANIESALSQLHAVLKTG